MDNQIHEPTRIVFALVIIAALGTLYLGHTEMDSEVFSDPGIKGDQWQKDHRRENLELCKSNHVNPGIRTQRSMNGGDEGIQVCDSER